MAYKRRKDSLTNPYIALSDIGINLALIFLLLIPISMILGSRGWDDIKYREYQRQMREAVRSTYIEPELLPAPSESAQKDHNDSKGEQRWTFHNIEFLHIVNNTTATSAIAPVADTGYAVDQKHSTQLDTFAKLLHDHPKLWWRIRIEAHSRLIAGGDKNMQERQSLLDSAARAVAVRQYLYERWSIQPYQIAFSGRGCQDPLDKSNLASRTNQRIDILVVSPSQSDN